MAERVKCAVAALAMMLLLVGVVVDGRSQQFAGARGSRAAHTAVVAIVVTIRNTFPTSDLAVRCNLAAEPRPGVILLSPGDTMAFVVIPEVQQRRSCHLSAVGGSGAGAGAGAGEQSRQSGTAVFEGTFVLWQDHMPVPPMREPLCDDGCTWLVDAEGLSVIRHAGSAPLHIYDWPQNFSA